MDLMGLGAGVEWEAGDVVEITLAAVTFTGGGTAMELGFAGGAGAALGTTGANVTMTAAQAADANGSGGGSAAFALRVRANDNDGSEFTVTNLVIRRPL